MATTTANADLRMRLNELCDVMARHPELAGVYVSATDGMTHVAIAGMYSQDLRELTVRTLAAELHLPEPAFTGGRSEYSTRDAKRGVDLWTSHADPEGMRR